jgi:hypothetical protein
VSLRSGWPTSAGVRDGSLREAKETPCPAILRDGGAGDHSTSHDEVTKTSNYIASFAASVLDLR